MKKAFTFLPGHRSDRQDSESGKFASGLFVMERLLSCLKSPIDLLSQAVPVRHSSGGENSFERLNGMELFLVVPN
jgi:hypothetical protein